MYPKKEIIFIFYRNIKISKCFLIGHVNITFFKNFTEFIYSISLSDIKKINLSNSNNVFKIALFIFWTPSSSELCQNLRTS